MYVIPDSKTVILFNPRTGSSTLHRLLRHFCGDRLLTPYDPVHMHIPFYRLREEYDGPVIDDYRMFAFARHPVSWFDSCVKYNWNKYLDVKPEFHKNISPRAHLEKGHFGYQCHILGSRDWLDTDNVIFNFHDFTNEIIRLFSYLDVELTPEDVEKYSNHVTWKNWNREYSDFELERIRYWYWLDYHFLKFMGWECDNSLNTLIKGSNFNEFRKTDHYLRKSLAPLDAVEQLGSRTGVISVGPVPLQES